MAEREVWNVGERTPRMKVLKIKWLYSVKNEGGDRKYKESLVADGARQQCGIVYDRDKQPRHKEIINKRVTSYGSQEEDETSTRI